MPFYPTIVVSKIPNNVKQISKITVFIQKFPPYILDYNSIQNSRIFSRSKSMIWDDGVTYKHLGRPQMTATWECAPIIVYKR